MFCNKISYLYFRSIDKLIVENSFKNPEEAQTNECVGDSSQHLNKNCTSETTKYVNHIIINIL